MIAVPSGVRVWLAGGVTDMRRGMNGLALQVHKASAAIRTPATFSSFAGAEGTRSRFSGTTASACRSMRNAWNTAGSSGRARPMAPLRSRLRSLDICSTQSTGVILVGRIGRARRDRAAT